MRVSLWVLGFLGLAGAALAVTDDDPNYWLTEIHGEKAQAWVKQQNAKSEAELKAGPEYAQDRAAIQKFLDTKDRIPLGQLDHGKLYNFWQDASHVRGLWRRAPMADYRKADPAWEVLLDVDKLDADQHKDWVFQGAQCTPSDKRCLVRLSPGGGDASEAREFDPRTHQLLADGFTLPAAKSSASYVDEDTILFATDFGPGTLTKSSYPRIMKLWHRGQTLADAKKVFEVGENDISVRDLVLHGPHGQTTKDATVLIERGISFFQSEYYFMTADGTTTKLPVPLGANLKGRQGTHLIFMLRDEWKEQGQPDIAKGSLISLTFIPPPQNGPLIYSVSVLFTPDAHTTINDVSAGRDVVYASIYHDVTGSTHTFRHDDKNGWSDTAYRRQLSIVALPARSSPI